MSHRAARTIDIVLLLWLLLWCLIGYTLGHAVQAEPVERRGDQRG